MNPPPAGSQRSADDLLQKSVNSAEGDERASPSGGGHTDTPSSRIARFAGNLVARRDTGSVEAARESPDRRLSWSRTDDECSQAAATVSQTDDGICRFAGISERMMGLEPTTFCMASASDVRARSRVFAQTAWFPGSSAERANTSEPDRTPNLAILATPQRGHEGRAEGRLSASADPHVAR
jgi:hypothetical protein